MTDLEGGMVKEKTTRKTLEHEGSTSRKTPYTWRCHDCGKACDTYRCPTCKAKWLKKHGISVYAAETYGTDY